jgi:hypothetical protein
MGRAAHAARAKPGDPARVRHPELLPLFCVAFAAELAHLRFAVLSRWRCQGCGETQLECACKAGWLKRFL